MVRIFAQLFAVAAVGRAQAFVAPTGAAPTGAAPHEVAVPVVHGMQPPQWFANDTTVQTQASSWNPLAVGMILGLFAAAVAGSPPAAMAADIDNGSSVFAGNCAACHAGGNNTVSPDKKLKKEELQKFGKYEPAAIVAQVTKGNGAMPAFGEKLAADDIQDVAAYVRAQADKGW